MTKITFEVTDREIQELSRQKLSAAQIKEILKIIENDLVLWDDIEGAIKEAIRRVQKKA